MISRTPLGLLAALLLAAGCAHAPPVRTPEPPVEVPADWAARPAGSQEIAPDWWRSFRDPRLDALVEEALANNQDLRATAAVVEAAAAMARIAGADLKPQVGVSLTAARRKQNFVGLPIPGEGVPSAEYSSYGVSLDVSWEPDLWGRLRAGAAAALADAQAAQALYEGARLSIAAQVAKTWFALAEARRQVELSEATVESFRDTAERVRSRYERGLRPSLDLRLALSDVAAAEAERERRRNLLALTTRQMEILLGRYPGDALAADGALPPPPEEVPAGLPSSLVSRRPDLVAAERRLAADDARVAQSRAALYPRLALTASGGTATAALEDLLNGDFSVWSLAFGLLQPLFQGGKLRAGVDLSEAHAQEELALYLQGMLNAFFEVESILGAEGHLASQEEALRVSSDQADAARLLAGERYDAGLEPIVTLLDAQRRALVAESAWLAVRRARLANRVDLYLALGGGYRPGAAAAPAAGDPTGSGESPS